MDSMVNRSDVIGDRGNLYHITTKKSKIDDIGAWIARALYASEEMSAFLAVQLLRDCGYRLLLMQQEALP